MTTDQKSTMALDDTTKRANQHITEAYDNRVYTSNAFSYSSPGHLRAAAHLYGLESVPLQNAHVLELGCAGGGNLLPFALAYPQAHVVGVDLSSVQVSQGQEVIQDLGIKNLHLHAMSLTDITPEFGEFDYIIAHGVFSWVPPEVRDAILRIVRDNLSPKGIAYISYNTYPGWKAGDIVRDAMLLHSHGAQDDQDKLARAKAMLNLLSDGLSTSNLLAPSLRAAVAQVRRQRDFYIAHEYLEAFNNPCYLLEFINQADQHGLTHVGDAEPHVEMTITYDQNVQLNHDRIALGQPREMRQQYLDFAVGRNFRKSLLVHQSRADQVSDMPDISRLADLRWAGHYTEVAPEADAPTGRVSFSSYKARPLHTSDATVLAVVRSVSAAWPSSLSFDDLLKRMRAEPGNEEDDAVVRNKLLDALQALFRLNSLRYTLEVSPYDDSAATKQDVPVLIPGLVHIHQRRMDPDYVISTFSLWHESVNFELQEAETLVLKHIDGRRSRKQLATLLRDALSRGDVPDTGGQSLKGQRNLDARADKIVGAVLDLLKRQGALI